MSAETDQLVEIMARLRDPEAGCPWDKEQTFATIAPHTIEEAYEVADAIERADWPGLKDELGDLLFQVVYHAQMAAEAGYFDFASVAKAISDKMVRRHPHVFGEARIADAAAQTRAWEDHKEAERRARARLTGEGDESVLAGLAAGLPALTRAVKLQKRAAHVGFDWEDAGEILDKLAEESAELAHEMAAEGGADRLEDEVGDLLFTCANLARKLDVDPEKALRAASAKFESRFRRLERRLAELGRSFEESTLEELEVLWQGTKEAEEAKETKEEE